MAWPITCPGHSKGVVELAYSATTTDGVFLLAACLDKEALLRDGGGGDWIGSFRGHKGAVYGAKLNAAGTLAFTASADWSARIWDAVTGAELTSMDHPHVVKCLDVTADDRWLATGCQDRRLRIFHLTHDDAVGGCLAALVATAEHPKPVKRVAWAHDGRTVFTGAEDGVLRAWDTTPAVAPVGGGGGEVHRPHTAAPLALHATHEIAITGAPVNDLELAPDGATLLVAAGRRIAFVDTGAAGGTGLAVRRVWDLDYDVSCASLHPVDGSLVLAAGSDVAVHMYETASGQERVRLKGHHGIIHCVRWAPDGTTFASGADDALVRLWRTADYTAAAAPASATGGAMATATGSSGTSAGAAAAGGAGVAAPAVA